MIKTGCWLLVVAGAVMGAARSGGGYPGGPGGWVGPENGLSLQSGYEGYLVPAEEEVGPLLGGLGGAGLLALLAPPLAKAGIKFLFWGGHLLFLFLIGSALTAAVCSFTPLCTISFLGLPFRDSLRSFASEDGLTRAATVLSRAIEKYSPPPKDKPKTQ